MCCCGQQLQYSNVSGSAVVVSIYFLFWRSLHCTLPQQICTRLLTRDLATRIFRLSPQLAGHSITLIMVRFLLAAAVVACASALSCKDDSECNNAKEKCHKAAVCIADEVRAHPSPHTPSSFSLRRIHKMVFVPRLSFVNEAQFFGFVPRHEATALHPHVSYSRIRCAHAISVPIRLFRDTRRALFLVAGSIRSK